MIRRLRFLSGILALADASFFLGEGLWAAVCAPVGVEGAAGVTAPDGAGASAGSRYASPGGSHSGDDQGAGCPFTAVASPGGCVSAALGAATGGSLPAAPQTANPVIVAESPTDLLLATSLFRPLRA